MSGFVFSDEPFDGTSVYCVPNTAKNCSSAISFHVVSQQRSERGTISPFPDAAPGLESWQRAQGYTASEGPGLDPGSAPVPGPKPGPRPPASLQCVRVRPEKSLEGMSPCTIPSRSSE